MNLSISCLQRKTLQIEQNKEFKNLKENQNYNPIIRDGRKDRTSRSDDIRNRKLYYTKNQKSRW